jgi:hypothetical protein
MNRRTRQRTGCGGGLTTPLAPLWLALTTLLVSLVVCAGHAERVAGPVASEVVTPVGGVEQRHITTADRSPSAHPRPVTVERPRHCPSGTPCGTWSEHAAVQTVRTTPLPSTVQALSALLPRLPLAGVPDGRPVPAGLPPSRGAPDLHVLQVQRT